MPHIHVEYSNNIKNIDAKKVLKALNQCLFATGHVSSALDIKSRAVCQQDWLIGLEPDETQAYVHIKLSLLSGRSMETQAEISAQLLQALQQALPVQLNMTVQMCVEVLEMSKTTYSKQLVQA